MGYMIYLAKSHSSSEIYKIQLNLQNVYSDSYFSCECPHYNFRLRKIRGECKHIRLWRDEFGLRSDGELDEDKLLKAIFA